MSTKTAKKKTTRKAPQKRRCPDCLKMRFFRFFDDETGPCMDCGAKEKALAEQIEELTSQANRLAMIDVVQDHQRDFVIKRNRHLSRLKTQAGIAPLQNNDKWTSLGKSFSGDNDES